MTNLGPDEVEKQAYLTKMHVQLDEWTSQINLIKTKVDNRSLQVSNDYHANMATWRSKKEFFKTKLDEILNHTGTDFESLRFGAQRARNDVFVIFRSLSALN